MLRGRPANPRRRPPAAPLPLSDGFRPTAVTIAAH
ncbi:hypothetical protein ACAD29_00484 [Clavibacter nebraskensis]